MNAPTLTTSTLFAGLMLLLIGFFALGQSLERPVSEAQWAQWTESGTTPAAQFTGQDDPASQGWSYTQYLEKMSATNTAKSACAIYRFDGTHCAMGGMLAPFMWVASLLALFGTVIAIRRRMGSGDDGTGRYGVTG